ncbi:MAG: hypothetical protein ACRDPR_02445, partial [Nocardioidaceae bacterium]
MQIGSIRTRRWARLRRGLPQQRGGDGIAEDLQEPVASLVRAAVEDDDPRRLIAVAQQQLAQPLG